MEEMDYEQKQDVAFFVGLRKAEVSRIRDGLEPLLADSKSSELVPVIERLAKELGSLSARLILLEEAAEQKLLGQGEASTEGVAAVSGDGMQIDTFHDYASFHPIETDDQGRRFAWTSRSEVTFDVELGQNPAKYLQIYFVAIIKPEYAKSLRVRINGIDLSHVIYQSDNKLCIECRIPRSGCKGKAKLSISLPSTHSLSELGTGGDWRELGIALSRVVVSDTSGASLARRLLRF